MPGTFAAGLPALPRIRISVSGGRHRRWLAAAPGLVLAAGAQRRGPEVAPPVAQRHQGLLYPGNHDESFRDFFGMLFGGITVLEDAVHTTADGRCFLVIHQGHAVLPRRPGPT